MQRFQGRIFILLSDQQRNIQITGRDQNDFNSGSSQRRERPGRHTATCDHFLAEKVDFAVTARNQRWMLFGGSRQCLHHSRKVVIAGCEAEIYSRTAWRALTNHVNNNAGLGKNIEMVCQALRTVLRAWKSCEQNVLLAADLADAIHNYIHPFVLFIDPKQGIAHQWSFGVFLQSVPEST